MVKKVLEMITAQALRVSNDLVKVVYIVSQVPWNYTQLLVFSIQIIENIVIETVHHDYFCLSYEKYDRLNLYMSLKFFWMTTL